MASRVSCRNTTPGKLPDMLHLIQCGMSDMPPIIPRAQAKAAGLKRYFSGKVCPRGHVADRFVVSYNCVECHEEWKRANPDKYRAAIKRWEEANAEEYRANRKIYREANRERRQAATAAWREANRDRVRAVNRSYQKANPDLVARIKAEWADRNSEAEKERKRLLTARRRAQKRGSVGHYTAEQIQGLLMAQKCRCANCCVSIRDSYHIDHVVPLARGGSNDIRNIQLLCRPCNLRKAAKDPLDFARENGRLL
jgi:5-methylcytosine-specific restriction endonuclease McrA